MKRIFLVGCCRSGTTLLQALIASHHEIFSCPEIQFFPNTIGQFEERVMGQRARSRRLAIHTIEALLSRANLAPHPFRARASLFRFRGKLGDLKIPPEARMQIAQTAVIQRFTHILDVAGSAAGCQSWLLKSPNNVGYIDVIEKHVPDALFLHIVRPGPQVVASIVDAARKYPESVWNHLFYRGDLDRPITQWLHTVRITQQHTAKPNHLPVLYDDLINGLEREMDSVFSFIDATLGTDYLARYSETTDLVTSSHETWKNNVDQPIRATDKFSATFNKDERDHILTRTNEIDLDELKRLSPHHDIG